MSNENDPKEQPPPSDDEDTTTPSQDPRDSSLHKSSLKNSDSVESYGYGGDDEPSQGETKVRGPIRTKIQQYRRGSLLRTKKTDRRDHFHKLYLKRKIRNSMVALRSLEVERSVSDLEGAAVSGEEDERTEDTELFDELKAQVEEEIDKAEVGNKIVETNKILHDFYRYAKLGLKILPLEVRMKDFTFSVPITADAGKVKTVYNSSFFYTATKFLQRAMRCEKKQSNIVGSKNILQDINLVLKPGRMYLLLGPPASGKSTLLRAMTGNLHPNKSNHEKVTGAIEYNGRTLKGRDNIHIENAFAYIDQLDKHAPRLSVAETFEFAGQCKSGGKLLQSSDFEDSEEGQAAYKKIVESDIELELVLSMLGLTDVKDTFVGDTEIRGVSGGQRRRVTVGEMLMHRSPVLCGDEISTGLDAASTYDMVQVMLHFGKMQRMTRIFALLQPSPDTVSLFDEVILLTEGRIIFAGPIEEVEDYFALIGYKSPPFMDVADFLQMVSTEDGATLYDPAPEIKKIRPDAPTLSQLADLYQDSIFAKQIQSDLKSENTYVWSPTDPGSQKKSVSEVAELDEVKNKYANSYFRSSGLIMHRFLTLWVRDKRVIIAGVFKNALMGVSVGGVYFNIQDPISIQGALFQTGLFIMLGAMQNASALVTDRVVFYKHKDANFYSAAPFVLGRSLSQLPQTIMETFIFATIMFFMIGLANRDFINYLVYLSILVSFAILMNQQLALFASFSNSSSLQAFSACLLLLLILFGGFIVAPDIIPTFYVWFYWWNPFAWVYRALIVNEFRSGRYEDPDQVLITLGFVLDGEPFGKDWIGYSFAYILPYLVFCIAGTGLGLTYVRVSSAATVAPPSASNGVDASENEAVIEVPFKPVDLSFQDICYEVTASKSKDKLKLLVSVNGLFQAGRMCALMGSSGAGKTTLMDVIALRKSSGTITGEVLLNGWPQDPISFRRCSGYVEQFDVQSPELTVRETILFSARLRLDPALVKTDEEKQRFVDRTIKDMELTDLADTLVGTDEGEGLSFEQKKRLSIAVELAASPSVIFLDEPTSGLDSRSALLVVRALRKIANTGRTVCATIHQPSSAVFGMFDDLLLLKRGGKTVFYGALGKNCRNLLDYFETRGAPKIELGENPANWMLKVMTSEEMGDLAKAYVESEGHKSLKQNLDVIKQAPDLERKIEYESEFATIRMDRQKLVDRRLSLVYWRSPAYNLSRLIVAVVIGFILGSIFVTKRNQETFTENDMRARLSVIFLTFIIMGILAILSVLPVMTKIRDMFYRHRAAGMYGSMSIGWALGVAEKWFIVLISTLFTIVFLGVSGMTDDISSLIGFFGFFTFNFAIYSYFGQAFVCLVKPMPTAIILSSVFIGLNNFFAGLIVRPQFMVGGFYALPYYIAPGHYVYEGLVMSLFSNDPRIVYADQDTEFAEYLIDNSLPACPEGQVDQNCCFAGQVGLNCCFERQLDCEGTVDQYIQSFFGGRFERGNIPRDVLVLTLFLIATRVLTFFCLKYIRFS